MGSSLLAQQAANDILKYIISSGAKEGERLPNEAALAKALGVGRNTAREAIKYLVAQNVLLVRQGSGTYVAKRDIGISRDPLGCDFIRDKKALVGHIMDLRIWVEPQLTAFAAINKTAENLTALAKAADMPMRSQPLREEEFKLMERRFHVAVARCSGNSLAPNLLLVLIRAMELYLATPDFKKQRQHMQEHALIADAIASGADAAENMRVHMENWRDTMRLRVDKLMAHKLIDWL